VLNAGLSAFSDRKLFQGYVSSEIKKNLHAVLDVGFEKIFIRKGGYDATANGIFGKLGGYYMLSMDTENPDNGFYAGVKWQQVFTIKNTKKFPFVVLVAVTNILPFHR
jgi:hypothetical protein